MRDLRCRVTLDDLIKLVDENNLKDPYEKGVLLNCGKSLFLTKFSPGTTRIPTGL